MHRRATLAVLAAGTLAFPAAGSAHVTLQPTEATPGDFTVMNVRVPNEKDDQGTTEVDVRMPPGFYSASYAKVPGWTAKVTRERLPAEKELEPGYSVDEQVTRVTFTGDGEEGIIEPGQFQDFPLSVRVPDGKAGSKLTFKALQTYEEGEVVRWIGAPDADEPAPQVTLAEAAAPGGAHGTAHGGTREAVDAAPASATTSGGGDGGGTDGLTVAALVVGGLGLAAGVAGLAAARRARPRGGTAATA